MNFDQVLENRKSVRKFSSESVSQDVLNQILESTLLAPTAHNFQPHKIIIVNNTECIDKLKQSCNTYGSILAIIVCADKNIAWKRQKDNKDSADIDASIISTYMMLKATDVGLSSVWIGNFDEEILRSNFNIPDNIQPVSILLIGYPDDSIKNNNRPKRKSLEDIIYYNKFE